MAPNKTLVLRGLRQREVIGMVCRRAVGFILFLGAVALVGVAAFTGYGTDPQGCRLVALSALALGSVGVSLMLFGSYSTRVGGRTVQVVKDETAFTGRPASDVFDLADCDAAGIRAGDSVYSRENIYVGDTVGLSGFTGTLTIQDRATSSLRRRFAECLPISGFKVLIRWSLRRPFDNRKG